MKNLVNALCTECLKLKPRCAVVHVKTAAKQASPMQHTLCEGCRKKLKGKFTVDARHK